ncbi:MAG: HAD-IA family hydrolase, partial [Pseudomonadales bacterium]|nr:HAD-IA family hydrolase [Pseudomonadales bacterium]
RRMSTTVLLDADGVIQRWSPDLWTTAAGLIDDPDKVRLFIRDLATAEAPCLRGDVDLRKAFAPVLSRWDNEDSMDRVLDMLTLIAPDREILDRVQSLRATGIRCCLASNQQTWRADYMSRDLGYAALFDAEFYSCHLGSVKPDAAYFSAIVERLPDPPSQMLFIDDRDANVDGARACGLCGERYHVDAGIGALEGILRDFGVSTPDQG